MSRRAIKISVIYNLVNQKFGSLLVLHKTENSNNKKKSTYWLCKCDCGNTSIDLKSGKRTQCWNCAHLKSGYHKRKDITGKRFGKLVVIEMLYGEKNNNGKYITKCRCKCDCGNEIIKNIKSLKDTIYSSCGCANREIMQKSNGINIDGKKFGRLTVMETYWDKSPIKVKCKCDCGTIKILRKSDVQSGHTLSCGCLQSEEASKNEKDWSGYISEYGVKAIKKIEKNNKNQWIWEFECPICNKTFTSLPIKVATGHTTSCGCRVQSSKEQLISKYLKDNNIQYIPQYSFDDCKNKYKLKFDFAIIRNDKVFYLIEYDGKQHYTPIDFYGGVDSFYRILERDKIKNDYCKNNNIPLLRLKYDLTDNEIIKKIANIIYP